MTEFTHILVDVRTKEILKRVADVRYMKLAVLLRMLADLFANSMDTLADPDVDITELRELYGSWQVAVLPRGE